MNGALEVIAAQRACRTFRPDPVDVALIDTVLAAATHAPSAENSQPWVFVVVRDPQRRRALAEVARRAWEHGGRERARLTPSLMKDVDQGATEGYGSAPVHVVVGADLDRVRPVLVGSSVFPAAQNLMLAATAVGLGSVLTTLHLAYADEVGRLLELPEHVSPVAVIPLGWPKQRLGPHRRRPLSDVAHAETFGRRWENRGVVASPSR